MRRRRKRRTSARGNLLLLGLLVLIFGGIAVGVHFIHLEVPYLAAESREDLEARRQAPENALHLLKPLDDKAIALRRKIKECLDAQEAEAAQGDAPLATVLAILDFEAVGNPGAFREYLPELLALADQLEAIATFPYFLYEKPLSTNYYVYYPYRFPDNLVRVLTASGYWRIVSGEDSTRGLANLKTAFQLIRLVDIEYCCRAPMRRAFYTLAKYLSEVIEANEDPAFLAALGGILTGLGAPFPDAAPLLEGYFRMLDTAAHEPLPNWRFDLLREYRMRAYLLETKRTIRAFYRERECWPDLSSLSLAEFKACFDRLKAEGRCTEEPLHLFYGVYYSRVQYQGLRLKCALHHYFLDFGCFPDSLDALSPAYLERIPMDPYSGKPFQYTLLENKGHLLYSVDWNLEDDGGHTHADAILSDYRPK